MVAALRPARWPILVALGTLAAPLPLVTALAEAGTLDTNVAVELGLDTLVVWSFLGSGLALWHRRPDNRVGPLLMGFGLMRSFGWLLARSNDPWVYTLGLLVQDASPILFVAALLAFPEGRLDGLTDRAIIGVVAFALVPLELLWLAFLAGVPGQPPNPLLISDQPGAADAVDLAQRLLLAGAQAALFVRLNLRWRRATPPMRRTLLPVLAGAAALLVFDLLLVWDKLVDEAPVWLVWGVLIGYIAVPVALVVTMVRARLARTAAGELLVELSAAGERDLPAAVGRALGDPSLTVAYWVESFHTYVDSDGWPVDLGAEATGRAASVVMCDGERVAVLRHDASLRAEPDRLSEVGAAAGFALQNARLHAELRARLSELSDSRARVLDAADSERRRLERDLHDGAQKRLVAVAMELGRLDERLAGDRDGTTTLARARHEVTASLAELRELAHGLHPAALTGHGLSIALRSLADSAAVPVRVELAVDGRLPDRVEVAAYYTVSEALTNVAKHARATAGTVRARREDGRLIVEVVDDGVGGARENGRGLRGLADRVEALGGRLQVWSPPGRGTRVRAEIPCA